MKKISSTLLLINDRLTTTRYFVLIGSVLTACYFFLMNNFLKLQPIFDEIWKLDVITSPAILAKIAAIPYALSPGWTYIAKLWFFLFDHSIYSLRILSFIWVLATLFFMPQCFTKKDSHPIIAFIFSAATTCLVFSTPMQSLISYVNPYTFEIFYSVLLLFCLTKWDHFSTKGKGCALLLIGSTPWFTFSPIFYLPYIYLNLFFRPNSKKYRLAIVVSAVLAAAILLYLFAFVYLSAKSPFMLWFWHDYLTFRSLPRLLHLLGDLPRAIFECILSPKLLTALGNPLGSTLIVLFATLGYVGGRQIFRLNPLAALGALSGFLTACLAGYVATWPLAFGSNNRVNMAVLWPIYFAFGVGAATLLVMLVSKLRLPKLSAYLLMVLIFIPELKPYPVVDLADSKDRIVFTEIAQTIKPEANTKMLVFPLHYSTDPHANFLLENKWPTNFDVIEIGHTDVDTTYLDTLRKTAALRTDAAGFYIIMPHFLFHLPVMPELRKLEVSGFILESKTEGKGTLIMKFRRAPLS